MKTRFEDRPTGVGVHSVQTPAWGVLLDGAVWALKGTGPTAEMAEAWIAAVDREWPFSFQNVCEALGIDPDALRAALLGDHRGLDKRPRRMLKPALFTSKSIRPAHSIKAETAP